MKVLLAFSSRRPRARVLRVTAVTVTVTAMCVAVLVLHSGVRHPPGVQVLLGVLLSRAFLSLMGTCGLPPRVRGR